VKITTIVLLSLVGLGLLVVFSRRRTPEPPQEFPLGPDEGDLFDDDGDGLIPTPSPAPLLA